jgi:beta-1,4-mannosyl-glycoprotein beta-1,4-N-acetylglucosaminyltransferase
VKGLIDADENDIILISDVDEIPNLNNINFENINEKIILFKQEMFYYKFNLHLSKLIWTGTKGCKKRDLLNPQWLRNVKDRKYPFFRLDTFFSKNKYQSIKYINDGGWHFTNLKTAKEIYFKLKSYLHHREFDVNPLTVDQINEIINDKRAIYNLNVDKSEAKWGSGDKLEKFEIKKLPIYIQKNLNNFKEWID